MIVSNAIPKAGGHLLFAYLVACGLRRERGELYADIDVLDQGDGRFLVSRRRLTGSGKKVWRGLKLRPVDVILADRSADRVVNAHVHDGIGLDGHRVAFIYRHPRDVLVSAARFSAAGFDWGAGQPPAEAVTALFTPRFIAEQIERCRASLGWLTRADVAVRYEDFVDCPVRTANIVSVALDILAIDPAPVIGDGAPWVTRRWRGTWSGRRSDWREWWNAGVDGLWRDLGGVEVESELGYA
jgi:hypothetical protein